LYFQAAEEVAAETNVSVQFVFAEEIYGRNYIAGQVSTLDLAAVLTSPQNYRDARSVCVQGGVRCVPVGPGGAASGPACWRRHRRPEAGGRTAEIPEPQGEVRTAEERRQHQDEISGRKPGN